MQPNIFQILQRRFLLGVVLGLWQSSLDSEDRDYFRLRDTLYLLGRNCPFILPFLLRGLLCEGRRTCQRLYKFCLQIYLCRIKTYIGIGRQKVEEQLVRCLSVQRLVLY